MPPLPSPKELLAKARQTAPAAPKAPPAPVARVPAPKTSVPTPDAVRAAVRGPDVAPAATFGGNLRADATKGAKAAASAVKGALKDQAKTIVGGLTGAYTVAPEDVLEGVRKTAAGTVNTVGFLARGLNEGILRIGKSIQKPISNLAPEVFKMGKGGALAEDLTGKEDVGTYQEVYKKARNYAVDNKATPAEARVFGGIVAAGMIFMDDPVFAPARGLKVGTQAVEELVKADTDKVVAEILKRENPELTEKSISIMAPAFRNAKTPEDVRTAVDTFSRAGSLRKRPEAPAPVVAQPAKAGPPPPPAQVRAVAAEPALSEEEMTTFVEKYLEKNGNVINSDEARELFPEYVADRTRSSDVQERASSIAKRAYDVLLERRKGQGDGTIVYTSGGMGAGKSAATKRAGDASIIYDGNLDTFDSAVSRIEKGLDNGYKAAVKHVYVPIEEGFENALSRAEIMRAAKGTGRTASVDIFPKTYKGSVETFIKLAKKYKDNPKVNFEVIDNTGRAAKVVEDPVAFMEKVRYDKSNDEYAESLLKQVEAAEKRGSISRATAAGFSRRIQKEGARPDYRNGGRNEGRTGDVVKTPYTPSVPLVRSISQTNDKFAILNILKKEFPRMPDRIVDRFVKRLASLKRTSDIEGILKTANELNQSGSPGSRPRTSPIERALPTQKKTERGPGASVSPASKEILEDTRLRPVADILSTSEKLSYVSSITRKLDNAEAAAIAENEYDRMWDIADQGAIDRYNDLVLEAGFLSDTIGDDPAATLYTRYFKGRKGFDPSDPTLELQELQNAAMAKQKRRRDYQAAGGRKSGVKAEQPLTTREERALRLDTEIEELGYKDWGEAQEALEKYFKARTHLKDLGKQIKDLTPVLKASSVLRSMLDELPVVATKTSKGIDDLATFDQIAYTYKDIGYLADLSRDVYRNFRRFFRERFDDAKKLVLDPFDKAKGEFVDEVKGIGNRLEAITKKYKLNRGSKDSAHVMDFGEGKISMDELIEKVGRERAHELELAAGEFRKIYDGLIEEVNEVRRKIYPNSPEKLIPYRKDYFHHYKDFGDEMVDAVRNFFDTPSGIDPKLIGLSEYTKPKTRFLPFAQERTADVSVRDAVGGLVEYAPLFAYAKHIDPQISTFRYLRRRLSEAAPRTGEQIPGPGSGDPRFRTQGVDRMLQFLDDFSNDLAGKTNPIDRLAMRIIPGGRLGLRVADWVNNRIKANTILGNLRSSIAQIFGIPGGVASAKQYSVPGAQRTLAGLFMPNAPMEKSVFIRERYMRSLKDRFPSDFGSKPLRRSGEEARKMAAWITGVLDEVSTKFIWNSHYAKATAEGLEDPIKYADDITRDLVAGRGIGEVPLGQKSKVFQVFAPFQLEVGNLWHIFDDRIRKHYRGAKNQDFAAIAALLIGNYLLNEVAENTRGSRVAFDPINALIDGSVSLSQEFEDGEYGRGLVKFIGRQAGELLSNVPLGQTFANVVPDKTVQDFTGAVSGTPMKKQELFGEGDPGRFGESPLLVFSALQKPFSRFLLPFGGAQVENTLKGIKALMEGEARDSKDRPAYDVEATPMNFVKAVLFGAGATGEARRFYDTRTDLFERLDAQKAEDTRRALDAEREWKRVRKLLDEGKKDEAIVRLKKIEEEDKLLSDKLKTVAADEKKGLTQNDRLVKMLHVNNGERAKYIVEQIKSMKTREEKAKYLQGLDDKGLISDDVFEQIQVLLSKD